MTKRMRTPILLTLLIAAALVSAYAIVAANPSATSGPGGQAPAGVFH